MKINSTIYFALFSSLISTIPVIALLFLFEKLTFDQNNSYWILALAISIGFFFIYYFIVHFTVSSYKKKQIQYFSELFPKEIKPKDKNIGIEEIGEHISIINKKNISKIDAMKAMEDYRKEYIGNVSHELKTPLFSIQGYLETLMDGEIENSKLRDKYLGRINNSVERLIELVQDLDIISEYEYGRIQINYAAFDINELITEISELLDLEVKKSDAKIILETEQKQTFVLADRHKITQVFTNLITNALRYSNREKIEIKISTKINSDKIIVSVEDNGMGIKPEFIPRIFERFYRVESSRSRNDGGSGLGLAIVKHIIEAHNQEIDIHSEYLKGTKFTFSLDNAEKISTN